MGPNILFLAIGRDRGAVSFLEKACFVEIKKKQSPHISQKAMILDYIRLCLYDVYLFLHMIFM